MVAVSPPPPGRTLQGDYTELCELVVEVQRMVCPVNNAKSKVWKIFLLVSLVSPFITVLAMCGELENHSHSVTAAILLLRAAEVGAQFYGTRHKNRNLFYR